jgi:Zn-dependent peptidase ImmA (M78 family)
MAYIASAISRANLRELAEWIRRTVGYENKPYFPIVEFMENVMPEMFPGFNYEIVDDKELFGKEGETRPHENLILLPNTVYNEAVEGKGRARFSVAHEVSHYIIIDEGDITLARANINIPKYQDPEWQANALASEILIVPRLSVGMSAKEVADVFGVSLQAAKVHLKIKERERLE